jgi:Ca2+-transporting ATPase
MVLDAAMSEELLAVSRAYSAQALRVIALAYRDLETGEKITEESAESNLVFSGFVTMIDPPRDEVKAAVLAAKEAGLRLMMITGDHHATARSIANAIGMAWARKSPLPVMNSDELHAMNDNGAQRCFGRACSRVFARFAG